MEEKAPGPVIAIVVPCYNEEEALPETAKRLEAKITELVSIGTISVKSSLLFIDDGSGDKTWSLIAEQLNQLGTAGDEAAAAAQGLGEGAHPDIHVIG